VYAPGFAGSGAVRRIVLPWTVTVAPLGTFAVAGVVRTGMSGEIAAEMRGSFDAANFAVMFAPGNFQRLGALSVHAASIDEVERTSLGVDEVRTFANGAAFAVGVTAANTAPPRFHANCLIAQTGIHSPCQPSRPSGSMSQTLPCCRS
jgi:hypothetical protein